MSAFNQEQKENYMRLALLQAKCARRKNEVPIGAVVVAPNGRIIGRGNNARIRKKDATAHAEIVAIRKACRKVKDFRLNGASIFVTMEPCPMCAGAIVNARIDRVFWGAKSDRSERDVLDRIFCGQFLNHKCSVEGEVLSEQCSLIVKEFFARQRQ